jgi:hypothetical protein
LGNAMSRYVEQAAQLNANFEQRTLILSCGH